MTSPDLGDTTPADLEHILATANTAASEWAQRPAADHAAALVAVADALDAAGAELITVAQAETNLPEARLTGELKRTTFQLRLFAEMLGDGDYLDARIDHADPSWPMGARPDIRRVLEPLGPVLVFAASNFPFAFSVMGGDTCSALAAGCSVVLKAHPGHPQLSAAVGRICADALATAGAPAGLLQLVYGTQAGRDALLDPRVKAAAFTGSIPGGRALFDLANSRPDPIPFYGELGSVNPVFVTRAAAAARGAGIVREFVASYTMGAGQFCTKPGILLVPAESSMVGLLAESARPAPARLLNDRIQSGYTEALQQLRGHGSVQVLGAGDGAFDAPPAPSLSTTTAEAILADPEGLITECFGPTALVATYRDEAEMLAVARMLDGQLTATIQGEDTDSVAPELVRVLARKAGRVLWNQWPTGVSVTYAQQHGGPYPATTAPTSTSVGTAGISRFLRPVAYQGLPAHLLPGALRDENPLGIPQRVNGVL
ncbi:aldehyde dehydrogenase (plasmid) [Arthrobacter sp. ERGS1:01]|uniref:aldehyde dehydrogenase (NADP(+)) n=1 Tax=Arthrobacter sp. ERGS1:01 TaxID=1704044 RepID=UPI0006B40BEF|nr:aldehyde dehydrogenase (NADP(+)) [Arthrobacter sp. ERGS1:01]ALE04239.1 aldehyde dehydrogenase [Arthrobacter sp. ERGS1:01]